VYGGRKKPNSPASLYAYGSSEDKKRGTVFCMSALLQRARSRRRKYNGARNSLFTQQPHSSTHLLVF